MWKKLAATAVAAAAVAIALPALAGADTSPPADPSAQSDPTAPAHFYDRTYRLDVNLEDVTGTLYSATLSDLPASVPWPAQQWINYNVDTGTFDVESGNATCFLIDTKPHSVPCSQIADMVNTSSDPGVDATVLAQPVDGGADGMSFVAKKITVWIDSSGQDVQPPADGGSPGGDVTPPTPPAKFFSKNIRLDVNLQDVDGLLFDAALNDIPSSVPASFQTYLQAVLDSSTFELDASHATCFSVRRGVQNVIPCSTVATWLDQTADGGIDATILAKPVNGDQLSFVAKKITIFS